MWVTGGSKSDAMIQKREEEPSVEEEEILWIIINLHEQILLAGRGMSP